MGTSIVTRSVALRYAVAVALMGLATIARVLLDQTPAQRYPLVPYFVAIMVAAWYGGVGPTLLGLVFGSLLLVTLPHTPWSTEGMLVGLGLFWFVGLVAALISESQRRAQARATEAAQESLRRSEMLGESEIRAASVLATAVDGIIVIDERGIVESFNPAAERLFGFSRDEVVGQNIKMLMPSPYRQEHDSYLQRYQKTGEKRIIGIGREVVAQRKDGTIFPIELAVSEMRLGGRRMFTGVIHDVTERKRAEDEMRLAKEAAEAAYRQAEAAGRMKDEFLATLSHELRTPLNAILGWARLLRSGGVDPGETAQAMEIIERNAQTQAQLIEDLLDVSRIISGKLRLDIRQVDVGRVIASVIDAATPAAQAKDITIERKIQDDRALILGDPTRIQQIVWNLLSNAIKFTPRKGRVRVELRRDESLVSIEVSDTGKGISPEFLPHVFERFRQAEGGSTRRYGGLGLGLAIVRHMVELHGGTVECNSAGDGQGATFTVRLPLMAVQEEEQPTSPASSAVTHLPFESPPSLVEVKALVVDDQPDACRLVRAVLERCRAEVRTASSAREGLRLFEEYRPDVLVSDIGMPGEDGYWLIKEVRKLPLDRGGQTPAIALTAYARAEDRMATLAAGFQSHIPKPVEPSELVAVVASLLGRTSMV